MKKWMMKKIKTQYKRSGNQKFDSLKGIMKFINIKSEDKKEKGRKEPIIEEKHGTALQSLQNQKRIRRGFYEKLYANKFEYLDEINKFIQNTALITDKKKIWKFHIYESIESVTKNSS